ncbi:MAG TPA: hypothetical protein PLW86_07540 [Rhodocyclaceae bacterium]|nr:hypothetical protein [Rhodocyclaceae bacterium]
MTPPTPPKDALAGTSVVARADALMQRRRAQQASEPDDVPILTEAVTLPELEDFPVLTAIDSDQTPPAAPPAPSQPLPDQPVPDQLAQELTRTITARLNAELPHLVHIALQETLAHVEQELRNGIREATEAALRDFLNEQSRRGNKR